MTNALRTSTAYDFGRPNTFSKVVGNQAVVKRLTQMIASNRVPRLVFINGPTGSGKTMLARVAARAIICSNRAETQHEPCGHCRNCQCELNDTTCGLEEYREYDANLLTEDVLNDLRWDLLKQHLVIFIDELQDLAPHLLKRLRKMLEGAFCTLILTTSHPDEIEDAFRNRLKSFEFTMKRPSVTEVVAFLEEEFRTKGIIYESQTQLIGVAEELKCEMRPCSQFATKVLAEAAGILTDQFMDDTFGRNESVSTGQFGRRRRMI